MMSTIRIVGVAALIAGCGDPTPATGPVPDSNHPARGEKSVTVHVKDMGERLELL